MTNENSAFIDIEIEEKNFEPFKTNVFLKKMQDLKPYIGVDFVITSGQPIRSLFMPSCTSWDCVTGFRRETKERVECEGCAFIKGITIKGKDGKDVTSKCSKKYIIFMEHKEPDKQFALTLNFTQQKALNEYRKSLLKIGLDLDKVVTKITLEFDMNTKPIYKFDMVSELDLDITDVEEKALSEVKAMIAEKGEDWFVSDAADMLKTYLEVKKSTIIDEARAKRLILTISDDGLVVRAK